MSKLKRKIKPSGSELKPTHDILVGAEQNDLNEVVAALYEDSSCINRQHDLFGYTAIHVAVAEDLREIFDVLIVHRQLNLHIKDNNGSTAIDTAIACGNHHYLERLYKRAHPQFFREEDPYPIRDAAIIQIDRKGPGGAEPT